MLKESARYFLLCVLFSCVYIFLFHLNVLPGHILFNKGIYLLFLTTTIFIISFRLFKKINFFNTIAFSTFFSAVVLAFSLNLTLFILVPVTFDRSLSIFLLDSLQNSSNSNMCRDGFITAELQKKLIDDYIIAHKALEKRLDEQQYLGNITLEGNNCVSLSPQGKKIMQFLKTVNTLYQ